MEKTNLEKCKSNQGITLIALVITIIVLLILAGITIAMLTGSESAPAKANEAKQQNDIGSAKDQLAILVQNEQLEAYDDVYVDNNGTVKATAATTTIGQRVINAALGQYGTAKQIGDATMQVTQSAEGEDAIVTITTRDITEKGYIEANGGKLNWGEKPRIINFYVLDVQLQAEEGMTWGEWLNSRFNTISAYAYKSDRYNGTYIKVQDGGCIIYWETSDYALVDDLIVEDRNYGKNHLGDPT